MVILQNVNTIKTAFDAYKDDGNILDVLKDLFKKIKTDTFDLVYDYHKILSIDLIIYYK